MSSEETKDLLKLLKTLKETLDIVSHKVGKLELREVVYLSQLTLIKDQLSMMNEKLDNHTASLISIESTLEAYADMYKHMFRAHYE